MNTNQRSKYIRLGVIVAATLLFFMVAVLYIRTNFFFFVVSSYPENGKLVSTSSNSLSIEFNQLLKPDQKVSARLKSATETIQLEGTIEDKTLFLHNASREAPIAGLGKYQLTVDSVSSKKRKAVNNIAIDFEIRYLGFRSLPKSEQRRQINESKSFEDPIARHLPYRTENFSIEYQFPNKNFPAGYNNKPILFIYVNFGARGQNETDSPYAQAIRKSRKEALKWIEAQGMKPTNYLYKLGEDALTSEFPSYYPGIQTVDSIPQTPPDYTGDGVPPEEQPHDH